MAVTTWTAGEVLTAADLNDTFASKVDYALPVNSQTGTTYTFVAADAEKLTTASNAAAVTLTIPPQSSVTWSDNTVLRVVNYGAGAVTIDGGSGVTVTNTSSTIAQYGAAVAIRTGSDAWTVVPFGGGDIPAATVSSPAATGQYTDTGITYDYYTFTASGTLTVDTAGFADVLVVGGGGGGGKGYAGGGGAGGYWEKNVYLSDGSLTVTVGGGGAGAPSGGNYGTLGTGGNGSRCGDFAVPGGGAGAGWKGEYGTTNVISQKGQMGGSGGGGSGRSGGGGGGTTTLGNSGGTGGGGDNGGGGGGASAVGGNNGGAGGAGTASSITGSSVTRAGGGGGNPSGAGGAGGGGAGSTGNGGSGTANTGGGGGGSASTGNTGGNGGSGIVIVRVKV